MEKFDLNDILIQPKALSSIRSRSEVNPFYKMGKGKHLPIIAAPMDTVVSNENVWRFTDNKINFCMPRGEQFDPTVTEQGIMGFRSYGLEEFKNLFLSNYETKAPVSVPYKCLLIDIANGHMEDLQKAIFMFKLKYKDMYTLMVGNVANPETYRILSTAGADLIRIGIGNGNGCLTTQQTGVGYPMGSLIQECYDVKNELAKEGKNPAKIVADGGMKTYSDIIKSLALGADYVMVGSILNKALDSAGETRVLGISVDQYSDWVKWLFDHGVPISKVFRGMSTKAVQKDWGRSILKTSEGIIAKRRVEYTIDGWTENFTHYLRSAMSYSDAKSLKYFTGLTRTIHITDNAYRRFNK